MYYPSLFNDEFYNDMFDEVINFPFTYGKRLRNEVLQKKRCTTDIKEYEDKYVLDLELPGYERSEIKAELKNGYLVVSAEHADCKENTTEETQEKTQEKTEGAETAAQTTEGETKEQSGEVVEAEPKYICRERFYGKTERSFYVGKDVTKNDIKAQFTNGILSITVPKIVNKQEDEKEYISILD